MNTFTELGLIAPLLEAIDAAGYTTPTPIQAKAIQPVLAGRDLLGIAQTGTGKTAAFALPILQRLAADRRPAPRKGCRALILSPTRELATQIGESFRTLGSRLGFTTAVVFGGVGYRPQIDALARGVDILVAAPGRLLDLMGERYADLRSTEIFVLDEADQMLDLGFLKPIKRIVADLPARRQNLFFSATMPSEIEALTTALLRDPVKVEVAPRATTVERIDQRVIHVEQKKKRSLLVELLADEGFNRTLIFTRTKRGADRVARHLDAAGIAVAAIHGNKSQRQREDALDRFKGSEIRVLVATDIAARGIDVDRVTHVINFELPEVAEAYVHRIGRTARAGAEGVAISLCDSEERGLLRDIERLTRRSIPSEDRRNDAALAADGPPLRGRADRDGEREGGRGRQHHGRGNGHAGGRGDSHGGDRARGAGHAPARGEGHANGRGRRHGEGQAHSAGDDRGERREHRGQTHRGPQGNAAVEPRGEQRHEGRGPAAHRSEGRPGQDSHHRNGQQQSRRGGARSGEARAPEARSHEGRSHEGRGRDGGGRREERRGDASRNAGGPSPWTNWSSGSRPRTHAREQ